MPDQGGDRVSRTLAVTFDHPADWDLDDVVDELFDWSENIEDTRLVVHVVAGHHDGDPDGPDDTYYAPGPMTVPEVSPVNDTLSMGDALLLVEAPADETLEEWNVRMAALRQRSVGGVDILQWKHDGDPVVVVMTEEEAEQLQDLLNTSPTLTEDHPALVHLDLGLGV